jgi:UDP-N-acetylglucosamine 2-epimerase (non-hydrolysing)
VGGVEQGRAVWAIAPEVPARIALRDGLAGAEVNEPRPWSSFVALLRRADVLVTDSGDLEEAAPCFGAPVLSLRPSFDRPDVVAAGLVEPAGCDARRLLLRLTSLLATAPRRTRTVNPHGDGRAALRIADTLSRIFAAGP